MTAATRWIMQPDSGSAKHKKKHRAPPGPWAEETPEAGNFRHRPVARAFALFSQCPDAGSFSILYFRRQMQPDISPEGTRPDRFTSVAAAVAVRNVRARGDDGAHIRHNIRTEQEEWQRELPFAWIWS